MENIADALTSQIEAVFLEKGYRPCYTPEGKILVIDDEFDTQYKLDISFNNSDFSCIVLRKRNGALGDMKNFNVPWTSGREIRDFLDYLKSLD